MKLSRDIAALKVIAGVALGQALQVLPQDRTRAQAVAELMKQATVAGLEGDNARWVTEFNLAQIGYGGGL